MDFDRDQIEAMINVLSAFQGSRIEDESNEELAKEALNWLKAAGFELVPIATDKRQS